MQSYKWRNFKIHFWDQQSMFGSPTKMNAPRVHDLLKDPKDSVLPDLRDSVDVNA